jgi:hypothetical protein
LAEDLLMASSAVATKIPKTPPDPSYGTAPERVAGPSSALTPRIIKTAKTDQLVPPAKKTTS